MEKIIEILKADGWREFLDRFKHATKSFYKRFPTPTRCHCNDDKEGMQVCIYIYSKAGHMHIEWAYEMELSGGLADGTWLKIHQWALPADINCSLKLIPRMLAMWEFAAKEVE